MKRTRQSPGTPAPTLGELQLRVMAHLWDYGPDSLGNIHKALAAQAAVAYTTISNELSRLTEKKLVRKTGTYLETRYGATITRAQYTERIVARVINSLLDDHGRAAIHGFVDAIGEDGAAVEEVLRSLKERKRPR